MKVPDLDLIVEFESGEQMRTEISAKFRRAKLERELAAAGLEIAELVDRPGRRLRPHPQHPVLSATHERISNRGSGPPSAQGASRRATTERVLSALCSDCPSEWVHAGSLP